MKHILCVRLLNWPIDRLQRERRRLQRDAARRREAASSDSTSPEDLRYATGPQRAHGRVMTEERKRRWTHQMWREGPGDCVLSARVPLVAATQDFGELNRAASPLLVVRIVASRQVILAVSDAARSHGIEEGMTLAEARALCAHVEHAEHDALRDAKALEALARWMIRFTPAVSIAPAQDGHGIYLDVTGCERIHDDWESLTTQIANALRRFEVSAHLAIAPTPGAAWALASTFSAAPKGRGVGASEPHSARPCGATLNGLIIASDRLSDAIDPLPPSALRLDPEIVESLHHLGIETIGQLAKLPRQSLPARFGDQLLLRLDQAFGRIPEPLTFLQPRVPIEARMDFDGVVDSIEAIWIVFKELIRQLITDLLRRGRGARQIQVDFFRDGAPPITKTIDLSRPSRDPVNLFNLLRCAMEGTGKGLRDKGTKGLGGRRRVGDFSLSPFVPQSLSPFPSSPTYIPDGYTAIRLRVSVSEPLDDEQIFLLEHEEYAGQVDLDHLVERLRLRLGTEAITQAELVESHVPEKAWRYGVSVRSSRKPAALRAAAKRVEEEGSPVMAALLRPLHLFAAPIEIRVIVSPSEDRDGRPISLTHRGRVHRLLHAVGPERIAGQWWEGHNKTRDYFDAEDEWGKRFWMFRVNETGKWFWQGVFE